MRTTAILTINFTSLIPSRFLVLWTPVNSPLRIKEVESLGNNRFYGIKCTSSDSSLRDLTRPNLVDSFEYRSLYLTQRSRNSADLLKTIARHRRLVSRSTNFLIYAADWGTGHRDVI